MHGLNLLLVVLYQIIVIVAVVHVVLDNRQPAKTMAWALVIWFIPIVGIIAYLFFGINTRRERMVSQRSLDELSKRSMLGFVEQQDLHLPERHMPVIDLFINEGFSLPFKVASVDLLTDGYQLFPTLLADIARATSHIHIDMYIFEDDPLGRLVSDALIEKARQGVEVRVVYDDVGCWNVSHQFFEHMREEGIEVVPFLPVRFPSFTSKVNYRNHRKLIVVDGLVGYIGGINIALRYVKGVARKSEDGKGKQNAGWRDTMVRITGTAVYSLQRAFLVDWYFVDRTLLSDRKYYPMQKSLNAEGGMLNENSSLNVECGMLNENSSSAESNLTPHSTFNTPREELTPRKSLSTIAQTVTSGPVTPYPEIMQGYVRFIHDARQYIYIETPYFLPTEPVLFALKTAAISGLDVRLLVPKENDAWFAEWASRSYLREAQEAGVKVSLYTGGFLHSKLMVCDDSVCTCGSTNVDFRSFENNFEANTFFYGEDVAVRMKQLFLDDETHAVALDSLPERMSPRFVVRLFESFIRLLSPLM